MNKPILKDMEVRIESKGPVGNTATITINDNIIPVLSADIRIRPGDLITVEAVVYAKDIDIVAMENNTQIKVVKDEPTNGN